MPAEVKPSKPEEESGHYVDFDLAFEIKNTPNMARCGVAIIVAVDGHENQVAVSVYKAKRAYRILGKIIKRAENLNRYGH